MNKDVEQNSTEGEALFLQAERAEERGRFAEATTLLLQAAKLGHTGAQVNLGNNFARGVGVRSSDSRAAYWYQLAYRNGNESGAFNLAIDRLKQNRIRSAIFWLKRAVGMGSGEAALELAKVYLNRPKDKIKAIRLLQLTQEMRGWQISEQDQEEAANLLSSIRKDVQQAG